MPIDFSDTYQLEVELEESARKVFEAADIYVLTRTNSPAELQQATPRVDIKAAIGAATGLKKIRPSDGNTAWAAWRAQIGVQTVVAQANDGDNILPMAFVSKVRQIMAVFAQNSWADTTNFPNLILAEPLRDSGTNINTKAGDGFEYAAIGYSGIAAIRDTATW